MALAHRVGVARVDEVDDQHVALLVDVDRHLVGRLAGEHAPQRDGVARALAARDLDEAGLPAAAQAEARRPPAAAHHLDRRRRQHRAERDEPGQRRRRRPAAGSRGRSATASTRPSSSPAAASPGLALVITSR